MSRTSAAPAIVTLPPQLSTEESLRLIRTHLRCTPTQARVVLAGASDRTCAEIAAELMMAESTVRAHYHAFFERARCGGRNQATALVIALLWQSASGLLLSDLGQSM